MKFKIGFIADTHGRHCDMGHPIPECDFLIAAGDVTGYGSRKELEDFVDWMSEQAPQGALIAGNHDRCFESHPSESRVICSQRNIRYLEDESMDFMGLNIYGSPWTPKFYNWHFMLDRDSDELRQKWQQIPEGVDILVTHGPPSNVLDWSLYDGGSNAGCGLLHSEVMYRIRPRYHVFGHIHYSYGYIDHKDVGIKFINASICNENYEPIRAPWVEEVEVL